VRLKNVLVPILVAALAAAFGDALAQNKPPIAAPVTTIKVDALPVVRSQSQVVADFVSGLIPGLMTNARQIEGVGFIAISDGHISVRKDFGMPDADKPFAAGTMTELIDAIAVMQQIELGKMSATDTVAPGVTVGQALTHQAAAGPRALARAVERASGQEYSAYLTERIFMPLKMAQTAIDAKGLHTTIGDMGQLAAVLLNGGAAGDGRILKAGTVAQMERTQLAPHPALPGWTYGFAQERRNGWLGLQRDGEASGVQTRLVLVPESHFGYFVVVKGRAGADFWHTLDNSVLDHVLTPRDTGANAGGAPPPDVALARAAAGMYGPSRDPMARVAPLKIAGVHLTVSAGQDASLILAGPENATLTPREGGYWSSNDGNTQAAYRDGELMLSSGVFELLPLWQRWDIYLLCALAAAFMTTAALTFEPRRRRSSYAPSNIVLAGGTATLALLLAAGLMWLFAPLV
jgi:hypothetical protein